MNLEKVARTARLVAKAAGLAVATVVTVVLERTKVAKAAGSVVATGGAAVRDQKETKVGTAAGSVAVMVVMVVLVDFFIF